MKVAIVMALAAYYDVLLPVKSPDRFGSFTFAYYHLTDPLGITLTDLAPRCLF